MKWLFFTVLLLVGFLGFRTYLQHVNAEKDRIAEEALQRERDEKSAQARADYALTRRPVMAISKLIGPLAVSVMAPIDTQKPWDLVPQLEITKQRVLDHRAPAEPERKLVYERAGEAFDGLIALAEERTKLIEEMLRNKTRSNPLDQPGRPSASGDFFNRGVSKRWDDLVGRYKPAINQRMEALRAAERTWNAKLDYRNNEEVYELPSLDAVVITVDPAPDPNASIGANSANNGKVTRAYRRYYYDANGYRYPAYSQ